MVFNRPNRFLFHRLFHFQAPFAPHLFYKWREEKKISLTHTQRESVINKHIRQFVNKNFNAMQTCSQLILLIVRLIVACARAFRVSSTKKDDFSFSFPFPSIRSWRYGIFSIPINKIIKKSCSHPLTHMLFYVIYNLSFWNQWACACVRVRVFVYCW